MRISWHKIHWLNTLFLFGTFITTITAAPLYLWYFGLDTFQLVLFLIFFIATGLSITLGYHRLFSHFTFEATWPVKLGTLLFGAAAFEGSALGWSADHRRHHKHVDHEEDPYDINKGFFHAHIGWLLFRHGPETPLTWVRDLQKDKLAWWQHRHYVPLALGMGFVLPALIGWLWGGWQAALGGFLLAGVARVVFVHHMTFCINSLCHWIGSRPYSTNCSARDSMLMAFFTFGEGYHNYHHEFQHDYRNGVKPWQFDPTKWTIWMLAKVGLVRNLRTVPDEKILRAQILEQERRMARVVAAKHESLRSSMQDIIAAGRAQVDEAFAEWARVKADYTAALDRRREISRCQRKELKRQLDAATNRMREAWMEWVNTRVRLESELEPV